MPELRVCLVESLDSLEALENDWLALWNGCPSATPFQRPEWLLAWARQFCAGNLRSVAIFEGRRLVGLVPLLQYDGTQGRTLALVGAGISDYLDALIAPGLERPALHLVEQCLLELGDWQACDLDSLQEGAILFQSLWGKVFEKEIHLSAYCPGIEVPSEAKTLRDVAPSMDRRLARALRNAKRLGAVAIQQAEGPAVGELLQSLIEIHSRQWQAKGQSGVLSEPKIRAFHQEVTRRLAGAEVLWLSGVSIGGQRAAVLYALWSRKTLYLYLSGLDPDFSHASPGLILIGHAVERALLRGVRRVDFLRGQEGYKYEWGASDRPTWKLSLKARR